MVKVNLTIGLFFAQSFKQIDLEAKINVSWLS